MAGPYSLLVYFHFTFFKYSGPIKEVFVALPWPADSDEGIPPPYVSQMKVWASPGVITASLPQRIFCFGLEERHGRTKKGGNEGL